MITELVMGAIAGVFTVIGWLLSNKDKKQGEEIRELKDQHEKGTEALFKLVHAQQKDLADYKLKIAENHYPKNELDERFRQLNATITEGFSDLSRDIKEMTRTMHEHFKEHHSKGGQ